MSTAGTRNFIPGIKFRGPRPPHESTLLPAMKDVHRDRQSRVTATPKPGHGDNSTTSRLRDLRGKHGYQNPVDEPEIPDSSGKLWLPPGTHMNDVPQQRNYVPGEGVQPKPPSEPMATMGAGRAGLDPRLEVTEGEAITGRSIWRRGQNINFRPGPGYVMKLPSMLDETRFPKMNPPDPEMERERSQAMDAIAEMGKKSLQMLKPQHDAEREVVLEKNKATMADTWGTIVSPPKASRKQKARTKTGPVTATPKAQL